MLKVSVMAAWMAIAATAWGAGGAPPIDPAACKPSSSLMRLAGLAEASGLVASRATPGRLWSHNDSGKPEIVAIDAMGNVTGQVVISGARVQDWEAMTTAPCAGGWCLFLGDIGDNNARRQSITIYRVPEPAKAAGAARVDAVITASYPDGAHDAEALLALPDGALYIVTKGDTGHVALYRVPKNDGGAVRLERVGQPLSKGTPAASARITDAAASPDGEWIVLRTRTTLTFYRASDFLKGTFKEARTVDVTSLGEPQGEAVAFGAANTVYLAGEGGGKSQPGTLAVLSCAN